MRPIRLEMQAFGPYVNKEVVDFQDLSRNGMFLIKGPTGSGKTTIFDALTFALYGESSGTEGGKVGRNSLEKWRCNQAGPDSECYVSFTFMSGGKKYNFTRKSVRKTKNLHEIVDASVFDDEGNMHPLFENPKAKDLNDKAAELIGLTRDQFRQVVLLPQGKFEKFLTAGSEEKEEILSKIFDTDRWGEYAQRFYAKAEATKSALDEKKKYVAGKLQEEKAANVEELSERARDLSRQLEELEEAHTAFHGDEKRSKLDEEKLLEREFESFDKNKEKVASLLGKRAEIDRFREELEQANRAEAVRPFINEVSRCERESDKREKALNKIRAQEPELKAKAEERQRQLDAFTAESPVEKYQEKVTLLESKRGDYASVSEVKGRLDQALAALNTADQQYMKAAEEYDWAADTARQNLDNFRTARELTNTYREKYYAGIYGIIASEQLEEGEPCPVCGSREHPNPAVMTPESVTKDMLEAAEEAEKKAEKNWQKSDEAVQIKNTAREEKQKTKSDREREHKAVSTELETVKKNLIAGINTESELETEINKINHSIKEYKDKLESLKHRAEEAAKACLEQETNVNNAVLELKTASDALAASQDLLLSKLTETGFLSLDRCMEMLRDDKARTKLNKDITAYETELKASQLALEEKGAELENKTRPDSSTFDSREQEIAGEKENYIAAKTNLTIEIERLSKLVDSLIPLQKECDENLPIAEQDLALARKLRGDTGMGLKRYILGVMFNQVIGEANRMLLDVHGGRYQLQRSDEKGKGNKRGLELIAHDNRVPNEEGRNVSMLSGGEKFLVSLALSIGMSAVAQKSGLKLDALFIDEGFGTLDESSINDAITVLESVKRNSGMIGIISHVKVLDENITRHLEVVKTASGSRIVVN